mgnify:CR=1 FL=1
MDTSLYRFVGVSKGPNGRFAVRYTNDKNRERVLVKNGHSEVMFLEMEQPERVEECMDALLTYVEQNLAFEYAEAVKAEAVRVGFVV